MWFYLKVWRRLSSGILYRIVFYKFIDFPPKYRRISIRLNGVKFQKTKIFIVTAVKTSDAQKLRLNRLFTWTDLSSYRTLASLGTRVQTAKLISTETLHDRAIVKFVQSLQFQITRSFNSLSATLLFISSLFSLLHRACGGVTQLLYQLLYIYKIYTLKHQKRSNIFRS